MIVSASRRIRRMAVLSKKAILRCLVVSCLFMVIYFYNVRKLDEVHTTTTSMVPFITVRDEPIEIFRRWRCDKDKCVRSESSERSETLMSLRTCNMMCGVLPLWPMPTGRADFDTNYASFRFESLQLEERGGESDETQWLIAAAWDVFKQDVKRLVKATASNGTVQSVESVEGFIVSILLTGPRSDSSYLTLATNESYRLHVFQRGTKLRASIHAPTFFGARHALETLSQLIWADENEPGVLLALSGAFILDGPRFPHRGLLVDSARNFLPLSVLRTTVDAMAACKLNTLHWHLTDSQSFPFDSPRQPYMARYGAYSPDKVYSAQDVASLVDYARVRGVRVLAEMDTPAHAGAGWQWGPPMGLGNLSVCYGAHNWKRYCGEPPCGQVNPSNYHTYELLRDLYTDLVELTRPTDEFHVGGDEVDLNCWENAPDVVANMGKINRENLLKLWGTYQKRALVELNKVYNGSVIVWSSMLTQPAYVQHYFPKARYVVQVWGASGWNEAWPLLSAGYRIVLSNVDAWYLDCGFGSWRGAQSGTCGPYTPWHKVYQHRPWAGLAASKLRLVLGGEACLWGEQVDAHTLDSRLWPRAAAFAERLWADPPLGDDELEEAQYRLSQQRERLVVRGVHPEALWPEWCHQNPDLCLEPKTKVFRKF